MSFAWKSAVPIPNRAISLFELSQLVAERLRLEELGAPRVSALEVTPLPPASRRCRPHTWARKLNSGAGPRTRHLGREFDAA